MLPLKPKNNYYIVFGITLDSIIIGKHLARKYHYIIPFSFRIKASLAIHLSQPILPELKNKKYNIISTKQPNVAKMFKQSR